MAKRSRRTYTPVPTGPLGQQAQLQAELRFSPEASALGQLLSQTRRDFRQQVRQERGLASAVSRSAKRAIPGVKKDYRRAIQSHNQSQTRLDAQLTGLSPIADDIIAASAREAAGQRSRMQEAKASAVGELRDRRSQAKASAQFNIQNARRGYVQNRGEIASRLLELNRERGLFTAATLQQLQEAKRAANLTKRGQNLTYKASSATNKRLKRESEARITGIDPKTGKPTATERDRRADNRRQAREGGDDKKDRRVETQSSHNLKAQINDARSQIRRLRAKGLTGPQITKNARKNGVPDWILNVARDLEYLGYVSRPNIRAAREAGVMRIKWPKRPPRGSRRSTGGQVGRQVGRAISKAL